MTTILVVGGSPEGGDLLAARLRGRGFAVVTAASGAEALALARRAPPDLLVNDLPPPEVDGLELCRQWLQDERLRPIPLVLGAAIATARRAERLTPDAAADREVDRPCPPATLADALDEVLAVAARDPGDCGARPASDEVAPSRGHGDAPPRALEVDAGDREQEVRRRVAAEDEGRRAFEPRRDSLALLRLAGRLARLGGWSVDLAAQRVYWSDEVAAIHAMPAGYSPTVTEGIAFYAPEHRARITEVFGACARDGTPYDEELEIVDARGARVWVRTIGEAVRDERGRITQIHGAFHDISDRRRAAADREALQQQLLHARRLESIGRLAGGVAHDFNNLLAVIQGYASLALEQVGEAALLRAHLEQIRRASQRAAAVTRQLLAFGRKQTLEPKVVVFNHLIGSVARLLTRVLGEDVVIEVRLASDAGNVRADPAQLEQVLMNLAANARDAMPAGGQLTFETANVELDAAEAARRGEVAPGRYVRLTVRDTGVGMDAETRQRAFEPFFTTKGPGKGTGLGLPAVYGVVRQSGGSVDLWSEPGRGATFELLLPRVDGPPDEERPAAPQRPARGSECVLVVEDEAEVRELVAHLLRGNGYQVLEAASGWEALRLSEQHGEAIHLLLTDLVMPHMGGRELAARLRERRPGTKALYMSGYAEGASPRERVLEPGERFLEKPFGAAELSRQVRQALDEP